ncbi:MAG: DUF5678 domain-containing protein [Patescibacteria group bacterium]
MAINWTKIYKKYKGMWIALKRDEKTVIASADSAKAVYGRAIKNGFENPIISFVPSQITPMVG